MIKLNTIQLNSQNPRSIKEDKFKKLVKSIKESTKFLEARPIVVKDGVVYGGNMRLRALQELGYTEVPDEWIKDVSGWTAEDIHKFIVVDNVAYGDNDWDLLSEQYEKEELEEWGMDVDKWVDDEVVEDEVPEISDEPPISRLGEIYQLGRHRLMCGDSTKIEDVEKLMDGKKADVCLTDPPYGINIVGKNGKIGAGKLAKNQSYSKIISDDTTDTARLHYEVCVELGIDKIILFGGNYFVDWLPFSSSWIIWDKRLDMNSNNFADGEMAWTNIKTRVRIFKCLWNGMIREGNEGKKEHPTQKPIKLLTDIVNEFSDNDNVILDCFLGSGSTLIACEQTNRICYGMEIDEKYCDVIRKRYAKFIGKEEEWQIITPKI